ncbi:MAG: sugar phosphate isomerase/epimerase, partial [Candidatus Aminicenantes bacterium]|nr:sugar phosphate isomerase/epimerase [Candidatus Aminicenantes bacterium]
MRKNIIVFMAFLLVISVLSDAGGQVKRIEKRTLESVKGAVASTNYKEVRIKKFPIAAQCWTFRKFTFYETLEKAKELGIKYLQPYPGQALSRDVKGVRFDHNLSDDLLKQIRDKLREYGISLVSYGVVGFENTEESMQKVFDFARKMRIRTIVTEPKFEDASLLEKMVKKYNINVAIFSSRDAS